MKQYFQSLYGSALLAAVTLLALAVSGGAAHAQTNTAIDKGRAALIQTYSSTALCGGAVAVAEKSVTMADSVVAVAERSVTMADSVVAVAESSMCVDSKPSLIDKVELWYDNNMSYGAIMALMAVESSFIPFPSEIVVPPAAYVAAKEESDMNVALVVLFATLGALLGALVNYFLSMWLGRPIIYKFADSKVGHLLLLSSEKIQKAEDYFNQHGKISTFIGRLIPGIRQLISIPAGLAKMPLLPFMLFTLLGAGIWNVVLAAIGYVAHGQADLIKQYSHELSLILLAVVGVAAVWFVVKWLIKRKKA